MRRPGAARLACLAAATVAATLAASSPAAALSLGFNEPQLGFATPGDQLRLTERMRAVPADSVRIVVTWRDVAFRSAAPTPAEAVDPGWDGYGWQRVDSAVGAAAGAGLSAVLVVEYAPRWAEGPARPKRRVAKGTWRPSATRLAEFMTAVARRYRGDYTPPGASAPLPAVRAYQVWNEPNFDSHLMPQHTRTRPLAAELYRELLAQSYVAIKAVSPDNVVVAAALAPWGDYPAGKGKRTPPVYFTRHLLCLSRYKSGCDTPAAFDVFAANVYPTNPLTHTLRRSDLSILDLGRVQRLVLRAVQRRTARAPRPLRFWVTEFGWSTRRPDGSVVVDRPTQARYFLEALYELWSHDVETAFWWRLRDGAKSRKLQFQASSGFYTRGRTVARDAPKPIVTAARLPFLTQRNTRLGLRGWAIAAATGPLTIERRTSAGWRTVATWPGVARQAVIRPLRVRRGTLLRARQGSVRSLSWRVR